MNAQLIRNYHILYETTNLVNNKKYLGIHSTNKLDDGYIGCGIQSQIEADSCIKRGVVYPFILAVAKYGYENFQRKILALCATREELEFVESVLVNEKWVRRNDAYNCVLGGRLGGKKLKNKSKEALKRILETHGNRYDYSEFHYAGIDQKIKIICKKHGPFLQLYNNHLRGSGCPKCSDEKMRQKQSFSLKEIVSIFRDIHGEKYSYEKFQYSGMFSKGQIICSEHGSFWQTAKIHRDGGGCPECAKRIRNNQKRADIITVINKFREVHGDKYDYSKVNYHNTDTKVEIICPEHGSFCQRPYMHKKGQGCPQCGRAEMWRKRKA